MTGRRKRLPIYPTAEDVRAMLAVCETPRDRTLLQVLWHTGARISEVLSLTAADIQATGLRMVNLKQSVPAEKFVFVDATCLAELREYCSDLRRGDWLFPGHGKGGHLTRRQGWLITKTLAKRAGVLRRRPGEAEAEPLWPHSFRHGYAVNLISQGVSLPAVQQQLGHADLSSTAVYLALADPHRQREIAGAKF